MSAFNRRSVLKFGVGGAAALAMGGVGLYLQDTVMRTAPAALRVLDERQYSILAAIAETLCPGAPGLPDANVLQVALKVDHLLDRMDPADAVEFCQAITLMENVITGLVFDQRVKTLSASSPSKRLRALDGWRTSRIYLRRKAFKAVSGMCMAAYWANPEVYAFIGYPGPPPLGAASPRFNRGR
jgi:hypothetical protein